MKADALDLLFPVVARRGVARALSYTRRAMYVREIELLA